MGVSVENKQAKRRIQDLRKVPAAMRFLSVEPLLESLGTLNLRGIQWVIVGGESGPGARPMEKAWVDAIKRQCDSETVAFFFKQWGGVNKKKAGRLLDGKTWNEMPVTV
jgi:protein gp37